MSPWPPAPGQGLPAQHPAGGKIDHRLEQDADVAPGEHVHELAMHGEALGIGLAFGHAPGLEQRPEQGLVQVLAGARLQQGQADAQGRRVLQIARALRAQGLLHAEAEARVGVEQVAAFGGVGTKEDGVAADARLLHPRDPAAGRTPRSRLSLSSSTPSSMSPRSSPNPAARASKSTQSRVTRPTVPSCTSRDRLRKFSRDMNPQADGARRARSSGFTCSIPDMISELVRSTGFIVSPLRPLRACGFWCGHSKGPVAFLRRGDIMVTNPGKTLPKAGPGKNGGHEKARTGVRAWRMEPTSRIEL
jgi:hypothetical protein